MEQKKNFAVYGNCQTQIIAKFMYSCPTFAAEYDFLEMPAVFEMTRDKLLEFKSKASNLSLLIFQNVQSGEFASSEILSCLPKTCICIKIPSLFFNGYNPEMSYVRQPGGVWLFYHDRIMLQHLNDFDGFQKKILRDEDFFPESFSKDCVDASLNELKRRECNQDVDVSICDFIAEQYKQQRLFHVMNHPSAFLVREMAVRLLRLLGMEEVVESQTPINPLDTCQFPIYRSHFLNLGMTFVNKPEYIKSGVRLSVEQFFEIRKAEYQTVDLDFASQDVFAIKKPISDGVDMAGGLQF